MIRILFLCVCLLYSIGISLGSNSYDGYEGSDSSEYTALEEFSKLNDEDALIAFYLNEMEMAERNRRSVDSYEDDNSGTNEYDQYESIDTNDYENYAEIDRQVNTPMFSPFDNNKDLEYGTDNEEDDYDDYDDDYDEEDNDYQIYDRVARSQKVWVKSNGGDTDGEGETSEDTETFYRKRRSLQQNSGICGTAQEEQLLKRISSLQEALAVLEKDLDIQQNDCTVNPTTESTTTTTLHTTTASPRADQINDKHKHHHTKVEDLPICEI